MELFTKYLLKTDDDVHSAIENTARRDKTRPATDEMPSGLPDALVISAGPDNFRFEDEVYALRMAAAGVKVTMKRFLESSQGFIIHCTEEWEAGQALVLETLRAAHL